MSNRGPLSGIRIVELAGLGPAPFAGMILADLGADVIIVERASNVGDSEARGARLNLMNRSRRSIAVDLKNPEGAATVRRLVAHADGLMEGFRPGVTERLGLGPEDCLAINPRLVYGRMTGWGQDGPFAPFAGHDIDYIALTGALDAIRRVGDKPMPPLNLIGDFGGGGMFLALGMVCGILEARQSGEGQVVDVSMVDGTAVLSTMFWMLRAIGAYNDEPGTNLLDTGAHFYETYATADSKYVAVGAIEPQFYVELCQLTGFEADPADRPSQMDRSSWPARKEALSALFRTRTRDEWAALLEHTDACAVPVLSFAEAPDHPHNKARGTFVTNDGVLQPAPAPRFGRTPGAIQRPPAQPGAHTDEVLADWLQATPGDIAKLHEAGAVRRALPTRPPA